MRYRTILLFGAPGAGKGTQGKILGTIPNFFHFACGDVFRTLDPESEVGRVFVEYSAKGQLVPDEATVRLWADNIKANTMLGRFNPARDTLVLDGIPRNRHQAEMLADTLEVKAVFYLTCPVMDKMITRLQRRALRDNRLDDANLEIIRQRLETYENETKPVLEFYGRELVHEVDSTQPPVSVLANILTILTRLN